MYQAVGNRCAVNFDELELPIPLNESLAILRKKGFQEIDVDLVKLARSFIGTASYRRGARLEEAPYTFDCSSLTQWLYGQRGIWILRRSIQQFEYNVKVDLCDIKAGDLVFTTGFVNYYLTDPAQGIGHVGIATGENTVIHAANRRTGITETVLGEFISDGFRGISRVIQENDQVYTFITPSHREVKCSDDFRWIILQNLLH